MRTTTSSDHHIVSCRAAPSHCQSGIIKCDYVENGQELQVEYCNMKPPEGQFLLSMHQLTLHTIVRNHARKKGFRLIIKMPCHYRKPKHKIIYFIPTITFSTHHYGSSQYAHFTIFGTHNVILNHSISPNPYKIQIL